MPQARPPAVQRPRLPKNAESAVEPAGPLVLEGGAVVQAKSDPEELQPPSRSRARKERLSFLRQPVCTKRPRQARVRPLDGEASEVAGQAQPDRQPPATVVSAGQHAQRAPIAIPECAQEATQRGHVLETVPFMRTGVHSECQYRIRPAQGRRRPSQTVSYTHLTLPTIYSV